MAITLTQMAELSRALKDADDAVDAADDALKAAKERARVLREETIPSAMQELGVEELRLETGECIKVGQEVYASIPAAQKPAAYKWLEDNGFGGLIRLGINLDFPKEEQEAAKELFGDLLRLGHNVTLKQDVHAQTLKAFLREQLGKGTDIPLDLFGARPVWQAKITKK